MQDLISALTPFLPMPVERILWENEILTLIGKDWSFNARSCWRVSKAGKVVFGCYDEEHMSRRVLELAGRTVVSVGPQSENVPVDPVFVLEDGTGIEIISSETMDPWTFDLPSGEKYVACVV